MRRRSFCTDLANVSTISARFCPFSTVSITLPLIRVESEKGANKLNASSACLALYLFELDAFPFRCDFVEGRDIGVTSSWRRGPNRRKEGEFSSATGLLVSPGCSEVRRGGRPIFPARSPPSPAPAGRGAFLIGDKPLPTMSLPTMSKHTSTHQHVRSRQRQIPLLRSFSLLLFPFFSSSFLLFFFRDKQVRAKQVRAKREGPVFDCCRQGWWVGGERGR
mmetsp:Transcript_2264/g.4660  ORF Transcript_2264/g.4660 Transcript_2264/m.4660 type:complete len:220 (+) Transcript_2264:1702-2361(+)